MFLYPTHVRHGYVRRGEVSVLPSISCISRTGLKVLIVYKGKPEIQINVFYKEILLESYKNDLIFLTPHDMVFVGYLFLNFFAIYLVILLYYVDIL